MTTINTSKSSSKSTSNSKATTAPKTASAAKGSSKDVSKTAAAAKPADKPNKGAKLPPARKVERMIGLVAKRWGNLVRMTKGWSPQMDVTMAEVGDSITAVSEAIKQVSDDFVPPKRKGGGGGKALEVNQIVDVAERTRAKYADVLDASDLLDLIVKKVAGKKLVCLTVSGDRVIIPRGHVAPQKSPDGTPKFAVVASASAQHDDLGTNN